MRFVAAQFIALLDDDLWLRNAAHANAWPAGCTPPSHDLPGVDVDCRRPSTACSRCCRRPAIEPLQAWSFFWDWDVARHQVRWMTAWDTTDDDVERSPPA